MGKKVGSVGMPFDQPAYGLVQATLGIAGTHAGSGAPSLPIAPSPEGVDASSKPVVPPSRTLVAPPSDDAPPVLPSGDDVAAVLELPHPSTSEALAIKMPARAARWNVDASVMSTSR